MPDPIVAKVVDSDGNQRWGATDAPWVRKGLDDGTLTDPDAPKPAKATASKSKTTADGADTAKGADDAAEVPADGHRPDPKPTKH